MEDRAKNFINTVIFVSRIFSGLKDKFLARKLYDKLSDFVSAYSLPPGDNVAQYNPTLLTSINSLLELLEYLEHSKAVAVPPLLYARRNLFSLKLQTMRAAEKPKVIEREKKEFSPAIPKQKKDISVSGNKERIYNYIKRSPNSRTKDIIYEFSVLSDRTVKRNLKELVSEGLVRRVAKDKAVYYQTT